MDNFWKNEFSRGIAIALVIIMLFSTGYLVGTITSGEATVEDAGGSASGGSASGSAGGSASGSAGGTASGGTASGGASTGTPSAPTGGGTGDLKTPTEIIAYYNESANKIKTNAKEITKNYEDMRHDEDKLVVPSALKSVGNELIGTFLKKNETPETWTGADITAKFPVNGESYVSKLTDADVASATCNDTGSTYEIVIVAHTQQNPVVGSGVGGAFEIIKNEDVMNAAGFIVKEFNTEYYECTIKCTVDKATGNITSINFTTPIVMNVDTKIGISATVGMTFEKDYTITY